MGEREILLSDGSERGNTVSLGNNREILENCPQAVRKDSSENAMGPIAQLKCFYINAHSVGNKKELETMVQLEKYDLIAIVESWWDKSHNWNAGIEGYELFRRDRQGRKGRCVALYVREWIDCEEIPLRNGHGQVESLWERIKDQNLVLGPTTCCLIKGSLLMRPSCFSYKKHRACTLSSWWGTSTTQMSAGKATQQAVSNPGDSRNELRMSSWCRY